MSKSTRARATGFITAMMRADARHLRSDHLVTLRREMGIYANTLKTEANILSQAIALINAELASRPGPLLEVTDHAVLRYMERVQGVDVDAIRQRIRLAVQDVDRDVGKQLVDCETFIATVVDGRRVVTVYVEPAEVKP